MAVRLILSGGKAASARPCYAENDWPEEAKDRPFSWLPGWVMPYFAPVLPPVSSSFRGGCVNLVVAER